VIKYVVKLTRAIAQAPAATCKAVHWHGVGILKCNNLLHQKGKNLQRLPNYDYVRISIRDIDMTVLSSIDH
jgi:hypothetical protein